MQPLVFYSVWIFVVGLCIGSFLNVCIARLPGHESLVHPPSHCPKCGQTIRPWENIPVISYLFLRGRCSSCGQGISLQYPLIELTTALLFLLLWHRLWVTGAAALAALPALTLASMLLVVSVTDLEQGMIPDAITKTGAILGVLFALLLPPLRTPLLWGNPQNAFWAFPIADALPVGQRLLPLVLALAGGALGGGVLLAMRELGRLLWGKARITSKKPHWLLISESGLVIDKDDPRPVDLLLPRNYDRLTVELAAAPRHPQLAAIFSSGDRLRIVRSGVRIRKGLLRFADLGEIRLQSRRWWQPREVLGLGDIKLALMLGVFLGVSGIFFTLMTAAVLGSVYGLLALLFTKGRTGGAVPFGPFLAGGGMVWLFAGPEILYWYAGLFGQ